MYDFLWSAPTSVVFIAPLDGTRFGPQDTVRAQLLHKNQAEDAAQDAVSEWSGAFPFLFPKCIKRASEVVNCEGFMALLYSVCYQF